MSAVESQIVGAQRVYNARAATYDDSWHPGYSQRFIQLVPLKHGQRVLDLCCGTGLDAFLAADLVGEDGRVVCIDISENMLAVAIEKQAREATLGPRMRFIRHDVTNLEGLADLEKGSFDVILCSNAFVLFESPREVLRGWRDFLKPGGVLVVDVPHEKNMRSGVFIEQAARRKGLSHFLSSRVWIQSRESFRDVLDAEGFRTENIVELEKATGQSKSYYPIDQADEQFEYIVNSGLMPPSMTGEFRQQVQALFREEFEKAAVDGKVEVVDSLYVFVAKKV